MKTMSLVKINFDSESEIENLYGIGNEKAKRIVEYRNTNGYFRNPEDLAKVEGIGIELALVLAIHIDWTIPEISESEVDNDDVFVPKWIIAVFGLGILALVWRSVPDFVKYYNYYGRYFLKSKSILVSIWTFLSLLLIDIFIICASYTWLLLLRNPYARKAIAYRKALILFIVLALISILSLGLGNAYYYNYLVGWNRLLENSDALLGLFIFILISLVLGPLVLIWSKPSLKTNVFLVHAPEIGIIIYGILISSLIAIIKPLTFWDGLTLLISGFGIIYLGVKNLRTGKTSLSSVIDLVIDLEWRHNQIRVQNWLTWINVHLPNVDEQKELRDALDNAYPPSKWRSFIGVVFIGAGGWLIVSVLNSVLDWFVQHWLDKLLPFFK